VIEFAYLAVMGEPGEQSANEASGAIATVESVNDKT
jgi:hypothetical protein